MNLSCGNTSSWQGNPLIWSCAHYFRRRPPKLHKAERMTTAKEEEERVSSLFVPAVEEEDWSFLIIFVVIKTAVVVVHMAGLANSLHEFMPLTLLLALFEPRVNLTRHNMCTSLESSCLNSYSAIP